MERSRLPLFGRIFLLLCLVTTGLLQTGCWATISELKKERLLREELEQQFQAFKRKQKKRDREINAMRKKEIARQAALLAQMRQQFQRTESLVDKLQKQVKQGQGGVAEMLATLQNLQAKMQSTLGQIDDMQKQVREILQNKPEQNKRYTELLKKYETLLKSQKDLAEQAIPARMFARARDAYKRKEWGKASDLFRRFTKRFGSHDLTDNAYLYLGDILRRRGKLNAAIIEYDELVKRFPQGSEVPVALFRLGMLHYKLGYCRRGRKYFRQLLLIRRRAPQLASEARRFYRGYRRLCKSKRRRKRRRRKRRRGKRRGRAS